MNFLAFNQFAVLLWKNLTLKRRQFIHLALEIFIVLAFGSILLIFREVFEVEIVEPYNYTSQSIGTLPSFLKNPEEWELIYVPSKADVAKEITENVKKNLNISIKVRGFSSETEFETYIKYDYKSEKVLAAIVFEYDFQNGSDPLPLQVKYHLRFNRIQRSFRWPTKIGWQTSTLFADQTSARYKNPSHPDAGSPVNLAASVGSFLYFASLFPFNFIIQYYGEITLVKKVVSCLSSNVALALGINLLLKLEMKQVGVKWDNLWTQALLEENLIFGYIFGMLLLDAFLYGLVTWYIETVFPGQYGVPQPWYFFLKRSYWFGKPRMREEIEESQSTVTSQSKYFEAVPPNLVAGIYMRHLSKEYHDKVAVNDLTWKIYPGQITVLLGHNGAGKSTTLSILTGVHPPTRGEAYVNGYDISKNIAHIRKNLGFCPQHDLLFNDLTLSEHLFFYCMIKGIPRTMHHTETDHMLSAFHLLEKRDEFSQSLNRGMKRKLSLIIALIGGSKVVVLDEPSSGMDPASRRVTWDILQKYKQDRTILLTTHYMDEADVLGDRIAIMVRGTLQCCGSSVFLKQIYGAGYHIVMEKKLHCDVEGIIALIDSHVPQATLDANTATTLSFHLPKEHTQRFVTLFHDLDQKQEELGIARFGASITTMEQVFLTVNKLAEGHMEIQDIQSTSLKEKNIIKSKIFHTNLTRKYKKSISPVWNEIATVQFNTGFPLYCQQFRAMLTKRVLFTRRHWKLVLLQILVIVCVTTYLLKITDLQDDLSPREMDLSQYGRTIVPYSISGKSPLALNVISNLKIYLTFKNQELREVQGNVGDYVLENKECRNFCIIALSIKVEQDKTVFTIFFNNDAYHSAATSLTVLDNSLFMSLSGPNASITITNKPQPLPLYGTNIVPTNGVQIALCLAFGMAIAASSFCLPTVTEKISKAKHIQFVSGVSILNYWLSALLWDLTCFSIPCCLILGVFKYRNVDAFIMDYNFLDTMMIFMIYGWCVVPLMYLGSLLFPTIAVAYIKLTLFNYLSTVISIVIHTIVQHYARDLAGFIKTTISNLLMVIPSYNLAMCISKFFDNYEMKKQCAKKFQTVVLDCRKAHTQNTVYTFEEHGIAKFLITLAVMGLFFLLLILYLESSFCNLKAFVFNKIIPNISQMFVKANKAMVSNQIIEDSEDEGVKNERKKVWTLSGTLQNTPLYFKELTKIYYTCPIVTAVRNISLVVEKSECFGLLGLNEAGKSATIKMLTGEEAITSGVVLIDGMNITENIKEIRSRIGYCPQSDPLLNYMTGRELLSMYARLWGVPEPDIYVYVQVFLHSMHLEAQADSYIYTYSGGNKRRLSTVVALMGRPSVIFLDDPSAGMDPIGWNLVRNTVTRICNTGKAVIVTSQSMEECEALCTRLAIMVKGRFTCIGSPQELKNKYGNVYNMKAKINMNKDENKLQEFKEFIATTFPGNIINQEHQGILDYYIPSDEISWGKVFGILEDAKLLFNLEDYSISQIKLEQIFLAFANIDKTEHDPKIKHL
ncbi:phospholipid-transporting ATPase ABCA3-like [Tenrec ecaudatus]|uniref:phospholipid-transporting ATPase ABCA3-like n=1 Tax=Tenrec ecaudatus TaxID=94439 RepID=UPI003F5A7494